MPARADLPHALDPSPASSVDRLRARAARLWRTRVLARRRVLAAGLTAVAVLAALRATAPAPLPTDHLWVAARDLPAGTVLGDEHVVRAAWSSGTRPDGVLEEPLGRTVAAGLRRGEPLTDARVVDAPLLASYPGRVALPVRVPDPATVGLLRVGDRVDLLAADPAEGTARTVARDAWVAALPSEPAEVSGAPAGRVVVVAVAPDELADVGVAAVRDFLTVAWTSRKRAGAPPTGDAASR